VHVTLRVATHVWNLRSRRCFRVIEGCFADARERFGLRVIEFSVMGNHLHLLVEADTNVALSRGMQGLGVRIARGLNRLMGRRGTVFADHHHARVLGSPSELVNAIAYVLGNAAHHYGTEGVDELCSSTYDSERRARVLSRPRTWLLKTGWRRARPIPPLLERLWGADVPIPAQLREVA
jgi:REP element-mobilizing transposase RayT